MQEFLLRGAILLTAVVLQFVSVTQFERPILGVTILFLAFILSVLAFVLPAEKLTLRSGSN